MSQKSETLVKSRKRVADHGEVFTPEWLVEDMLELIPNELSRIDSRILEPACGSGNFLVKVLERKLSSVNKKFSKNDFEIIQYSFIALMSTYGVELLADNAAECRETLLQTFKANLGSLLDADLEQAAKNVLSVNIIQGDEFLCRIVLEQQSFLRNGPT